MKKITLRKDYQTKVVPVEEAVGHYLAESAGLSGTRPTLTKIHRNPLQ